MIKTTVFNSGRRFGERQDYVFLWSISARGEFRPLAFTPASLAEAEALIAFPIPGDQS